MFPLSLWASVILVACNAASSSPSAPPSESPSATASEVATHPAASPSAGETDADDPTPSEAPSTSEPSTPAPADGIVVALVDGLRVRSMPGLDGTSLGTLAQGYESLVIDGPEVRDGLEWYLISGLGLPFGSGCATGPDPANPYDCPVWLGWAARAGPDGSLWLEEIEPDCADPTGPLDRFAFQPRYLYIACYGDETLTLRGWLLASPGVPLEDPCPVVPQGLRWLGCVGPLFQLVSSPDSLMGLVMTLGPDAGLPGDGGEIVVQGHFDDPAAERCNYGDEPERSVLDCRSQFVVDSGPEYGG